MVHQFTRIHYSNDNGSAGNTSRSHAKQRGHRLPELTGSFVYQTGKRAFTCATNDNEAPRLFIVCRGSLVCRFQYPDYVILVNVLGRKNSGASPCLNCSPCFVGIQCTISPISIRGHLSGYTGRVPCSQPIWQPSRPHAKTFLGCVHGG